MFSFALQSAHDEPMHFTPDNKVVIYKEGKQTFNF
jgi:hypothetical protein